MDEGEEPGYGSWLLHHPPIKKKGRGNQSERKMEGRTDGNVGGNPNQQEHRRRNTQEGEGQHDNEQPEEPMVVETPDKNSHTPIQETANNNTSKEAGKSQTEKENEVEAVNKPRHSADIEETQRASRGDGTDSPQEVAVNNEEGDSVKILEDKAMASREVADIINNLETGSSNKGGDPFEVRIPRINTGRSWKDAARQAMRAKEKPPSPKRKVGDQFNFSPLPSIDSSSKGGIKRRAINLEKKLLAVTRKNSEDESSSQNSDAITAVHEAQDRRAQ